MNTGIYYSALVIHIIGIILMAGTTFIDVVIFQQFWKFFPIDINKSDFTATIIYKLQKFIRIGMLTILLSGVTMMYYLHEVWGAQVWFKIKIGIVLLIIINGLVTRRRLGLKLKRFLADTATVMNLDAKWSLLKRNITTFHLLQVLFFVIIFILSVFKFN
jgi:hypothetical protein